MDIATDMDVLKHNLKFEIEDLSVRIQNLIDLRKTSIRSLLILLIAKRAKLFELRDKHMIFSAHPQIDLVDQQFLKLNHLSQMGGDRFQLMISTLLP